MSLGPGDSEPSQFRGDVAAIFPSRIPASKAASGQTKSDHANSSHGNSPSIGANQFPSSQVQSSQATSSQANLNQVTFDRAELSRLFGLYGRKVAAGEWRDYAIDFLKDRAVFSVFRRACEVPLYRIEKNPRLARRQGTYSLISATGLIIRRGHELDRVLRAIDKSLSIVAG
jgi:Protein of unknown function (DUF2794)